MLRTRRKTESSLSKSKYKNLSKANETRKCIEANSSNNEDKDKNQERATSHELNLSERYDIDE